MPAQLVPAASWCQSRYVPARSTTVPPAGASATARFRVATGAAWVPALLSLPFGAMKIAPAGTGYAVSGILLPLGSRSPVGPPGLVGVGVGVGGTVGVGPGEPLAFSIRAVPRKTLRSQRGGS